ncbi:caspase-8 [Labeo rohita]|uniref:caspase-8 n=1 Tax=Labeo rohita TaxID=84645 RepID=UPI0021E33115|nr:caspase-8 [Labeo rohita]
MSATEAKQYKMDSNPSGLCLIINNENFRRGKKREGSQKDVDSLKCVFEMLGFKVGIYKDQTTSEIKSLMNRCSKVLHEDCFVCCVLSHGNEHGILGHEGGICPLNDITSPFDGVNCPTLIGKPKVFLIQACRGPKIQSKVRVAEDVLGGQPGEKSENVFYTISQSSDFLIALSTVEEYLSIRDEIKGSWFIQCLCKYLKEGSERGLDILKILTEVNDDVSRMEVEGKNYKMTPAIYFTLRKTLTFRVVNKPSSSQMQRSASASCNK